MEALTNYLIKNKKIKDLLENSNTINTINDESFAFYIALKFMLNKKLTVVVCKNMFNAQNLFNQVNNILKKDVYLYVVDEVRKYSAIATSPELIAQRLFVLDKIIKNEPIIVICHVMSYKRLIPSKETFLNHSINLNIGDTIDDKEFINKLVKLGFKMAFKVSQPFEYSIRGGVIDLFSINYNEPVRIELFDKEIDSIRFFNVETQRTTSLANNISILPATDFLFDNLDNGIENIKNSLDISLKKVENNLKLEELVNEDIEHLKLYDISEYFFKYYCYFKSYSSFSLLIKDSLVYLVNIDELIESENFIEEEQTNTLLEEFEKSESLYDINYFNSFKDSLIDLNNIIYVNNKIENKDNDLNFIKVDTFEFSFDRLYDEIINLISNHYYIYIGLESSIHYNSLIQYLESKQINYNTDENKLYPGINVGHIDYNLGLNMVDLKLYVIGEKEIFNKRFKNAINQFSKYKNAITINSLDELTNGDYLVHELHGIGIYRGLETIVKNNIHRDYILIEYANNSKLYLPLEQFKLIRKYVSKEGARPHINKLGTNEWEKTKKKIKERVNELASRLVTLYSSRVNNNGFAFSKDDELQEAFENDFGYDLTSDQEKVLLEVKNDMESNSIMDRLLVGDVGFGKTEIAFRAAFKAINDGKQVALLCPTTLLARQHYNTALDRFRNFGVKIAMLSRLVDEKNCKKNIEDLKNGKIDFIIGTHRLLSKDIEYKNLGLLIVDEEHKFGVEHKERIKEIKQNVDVLTLSATPIPRTLQMALTGVRSFSTINTPIENRMPVQTYVIAKNDFAIKEIIERELARNGQVFYLNNKIERLPALALKFEKEIKNSKVAIIHGKMTNDQVEDVMKDFVDNKYNILLCTTIIENGIDIENVNTIIVEDANNFGLSQLYQIKGRVGRGSRLAYAYLMYRDDKKLSEEGRKRLQTIKEFASLGSGYKVAMRDLICRGAGDLLGEEQSGFIESVGIDMYIEMLHDAITRKKNLDIVEELDKKVEYNRVLNIDAYVPENYFKNDYEKIELYKTIDKIKSFEDLEKVKEEVIDETGKLPDSINLIFEKKRIDLFTNMGIIDSYSELNDYITLKLAKDFNTLNGVGVKLFQEANRLSNAITLRYYNNQIEVRVKKVNNFIEIILKYIEKCVEIKKGYEK